MPISFPYRSYCRLVLFACLTAGFLQGKTQNDSSAADIPVIKVYRQISPKDIYAGNISEETGPTVYDTVRDDLIQVRPGKPFEIHFGTGSGIEYRLHDISEPDLNKNWSPAERILLLPGLRGGEVYILEARYTGSSAAGLWRVSVLPYWYQELSVHLMFYCLVALLLITLPYFVYRYYLRREIRKRILLEDQIKTVQIQLNPHFVYNALSSIETLISTQQNGLANEYLCAFSDIMRETLTNNSVLLTHLGQDIKTLEKYIRIQQLRFGFRYNIHTDAELNLATIQFPPMLLQPSIENAVKHALSYTGEEGMLSVSFTKKDTDLMVTVQDNGPGQALPSPVQDGHGTRFTRRRIHNFNKLYRSTVISYDLRITNAGTTAVFLFKNWLE